MEKRDYYEVLGIKKDASEKEIKKAYSYGFNDSHKAHREIKNRSVLGNTVIDKEIITGFDMTSFERQVIYKIENHKIKRVYFIN